MNPLNLKYFLPHGGNDEKGNLMMIPADVKVHSSANTAVPIIATITEAAFTS